MIGRCIRNTQSCDESNSRERFLKDSEGENKGKLQPPPMTKTHPSLETVESFEFAYLNTEACSPYSKTAINEDHSPIRTFHEQCRDDSVWHL